VVLGVTTQFGSGTGYIGSTSSYGHEGTLVNQGVIRVVDGNQWQSNTLVLNPTEFVNEGAVQVGNYSSVTVNGRVQNTGTFALSGSGQLNFNGAYSVEDLGTITRAPDASGLVRLNGTLEHDGSPVVLDPLGKIRISAAVDGATLVSTTPGAVQLGGSFTDVTVDGDLETIALLVRGDLTLAPGTVLRGGASWRTGGSLTGQGEVIASAGRSLGIYVSDQGTLTIDPDIHIRAAGGSVNIGPDNTYSKSWLNRGTLSSESEGSTLALSGTWSNEGVIRVSGGDLILGGSFTRAGIGQLEQTGGRVLVDGAFDNVGQTFVLDGPTAHWGTRYDAQWTGGIIETANGGRFDFERGTLSGVTLRGDGFGLMGLTADTLTLDNATLTSYRGPENTTGYESRLVVGGLAGQGQILGNARPYVDDTSETLIGMQGTQNPAEIGAGITIKAETSGIRVSGFWINRGTLVAAAPGEPLILSGAWRNEGLIRIDGGDLVLDGSFSLAGMGQVQRQGGSAVIAGAMDLEGGTWTLDEAAGSWTISGDSIVSNGTIRATQGQQLWFAEAHYGGLPNDPRTLRDLTIDSDLIIPGNNYVLLDNVTFGDGRQIDIDSSGLGYIDVRLKNTVSGGGEIVFDTPGADLLVRDATLGPGMTVRTGLGDGTIRETDSTASTTAFTNFGRLLATGEGRRLDLNAGNFILDNHGTIEAREGGWLFAQGSIINHSDGRIVVGDGGKLTLYDYAGTTPRHWGNEGIIRLEDGGLLDVQQLIGYPSVLDRLANGFERTGGILRITNQLDLTGRTLDMDGPLGPLEVASSLVGGTVVSSQGSPLTVDSLTFTGTILDTDVVLSGNNVIHAGTTEFRNHRISAAPDFTRGPLDLQQGNVFDNVTLATDAALGSDKGYTLKIRNDLTLDGATLSIGYYSELVIDGPDQTIGGQGVVHVNSGALIARDGVSIGPDAELLLHGGVTGDVRNFGLIHGGANRTYPATISGHVSNYGVIAADEISQAIKLLSFDNTFGTLRVGDGTLHIGLYDPDQLGNIERTGTGTLVLDGHVHNTGKVLDLDLTGDIELRGLVTGGAIRSDAGHAVVIREGNMTLAGVTLDVPVTLSNSDTSAPWVTVTGGMTLEDDGRLILTNGQLVFDGTQTLSGSGVVELNARSPDLHRGDFTVRSGVTTIGEGIVVRTGDATKTGWIQTATGGASGNFINRGLVTADGSGHALLIRMTGFTNEGNIVAANGGLVWVGDHVVNHGLLHADGGTIALGKLTGLPTGGELRAAGTGRFAIGDTWNLGGNTVGGDALGGAWALAGGRITGGVIDLGPDRAFTVIRDIYDAPGADNDYPGLTTTAASTIDNLTIRNPIDIQSGGKLSVGENVLFQNAPFKIQSGEVTFATAFTFTGPQATIFQSARATVTSGDLALATGATMEVTGTSYLTAANVTNEGVIQLDGSVLNVSAAQFTNGQAAVLRGHGTLARTVVPTVMLSDNQGLIIADGGILKLTGWHGSIGQFQINPGSTLDLAGNFVLDQAATVGAEQALILRGSTWTTSAPITIDGGGLSIDDLTDPRLDDFVFHNARALFAGVTTLDAIEALDTARWSSVALTSGGTLNLDNRNLRLDTLPVPLHLAGGTISSGRITSGDGSPLSVGGAAPSVLSGITMETPLHVQSGTVLFSSSSLYRTSIDTTADPAASVVFTGYSDLDHATLRGNFTTNGARLRVFGDLHLDGTLDIGGGGWYSDALYAYQDATISGDATIRVTTPVPGFPVTFPIYITGTRFTLGQDATLDTQRPIYISGVGSDFINQGDVLATNASINANVYQFINQGNVQLTNANLSITGNTFHNTATGAIDGTGTLTVTGRTFINDGHIAPGLSPGTLTLDTDAQLSSTSVLAMQLGDEYDVLTVHGLLTVSGTLALEMLPGYIPSHGDTFTIVQGQTVTGRFTRIDGILPHSDVAFAVLYQPDAIIVRASTPGDANTDGRVNLDDFFLLRDAFGQTQSWAGGEFTGDGKVNLDDFFVLRDHFGFRDSAAVTPLNLAMLNAFAASVPEPGTIVAVIAILVVLHRGRFRRCR
jgi:fibronectin-binding autotransporter adhesin